MGLVEIRVLNRMQSPWRRLCLRGYGIIHNTEYRFSCGKGFPVNKISNSVFQVILQLGAAPFPFVKEMGDGGTVAGAVILKIYGLSLITAGKYSYEDCKDMPDNSMWENTA